MYESQIIKRIPGQTSISPKEKQGYIEDLAKLSKVQLTELLERQNALLKNKGFTRRLPDKGEKIINFKSRIEEELARRAEIEKTTALLERLNISGPVEEIEWTGSFTTANREEEKNDSDEEVKDEESQAIRILASHGRTSKITRLLKPPETLITENDLNDISVKNVPYAAALCKKVAVRCSEPTKESFKPYRSINKKDSSSIPKPQTSPKKLEIIEEKDDKIGDDEEKNANHESVLESEVLVESVDSVRRIRHWEITAATPPPPVHVQTLMIDLEESLTLEKAAVEKTIAARTTQAMIRLTEQLQRESFNRYREQEEASESSSDEDEEKVEHEEVADEDEEPEKDEAVVYSLVD